MTSDPSCANLNSQQTQDISTTFIHRRPNVFDVAPTMYKCYTNVFWVVIWVKFEKWLKICIILLDAQVKWNEMKWNESGFRPPLCTYRLNWARRTSWGWWDDWDDTVLQTQDSKFEPGRSEAEHATSRSRRLPTILTFTRGWGRNIFVSFKPPRPGTEPRTLAWKAAVLTTTLGPPPRSSKTLSDQLCSFFNLKNRYFSISYSEIAGGSYVNAYVIVKGVTRTTEPMLF